MCGTSFSSTAASSTGPAGGASTTLLTGGRLQRQRRAEPDALARRATSTTTHRVLDQQDGPAILVGHSYGGAVITEAGTPRERRRPRLHRGVRARRGRVGQHPDRRPARRARRVPPILPPRGRLPVPRPRQVRGSRSPRDLPADDAAFMADSQVPWGVEALGGAVTEPAWRSKPSWYLVATDDRMIPPPAQRAMSERAGATVVEAAGSHSIYVSQPQRDRRPDQAGRARRRRRQASPSSTTSVWPAGLAVLPATAASTTGGARVNPARRAKLAAGRRTVPKRSASTSSSRSSS